MIYCTSGRPKELQFVPNADPPHWNPKISIDLMLCSPTEEQRDGISWGYFGAEEHVPLFLVRKSPGFCGLFRSGSASEETQVITLR